MKKIIIIFLLIVLILIIVIFLILNGVYEEQKCLNICYDTNESQIEANESGHGIAYHCYDICVGGAVS